MSKIGKKNIAIPAGVEIKIEENRDVKSYVCTVKGPK
jgi:ribosomal protein L6P/L9E